MSLVSWARGKSPWVLHYETGSCNGCAIEVFACLTPGWDLERFGVVNTGNPKQADILLVTGCCGYRSARVLKNLYHQMPGPKAVVAIGVCASTGGIFHDCYNLAPGADKVIPVDVYVPGCAPHPKAILDGVLLAVERLRRRPEEEES
ncbi:MAG TPA: NADH-quinone oxidoreductase subunit NuoB [Firmicutes bacterium]|nr:NADH-quinone oxidoreductase subunit NuoB [Bacillota bacterium]